MNSSEQDGRTIQVLLTVRKETDDPSIAAAVHQAFVDGDLRAKAGIPAGPPSESQRAESARKSGDRRSPMHELRETEVRQKLEEALEKQFEEFQKSGKPPSFDGSAWGQQLIKVWALIAEGMQKGYTIEVGELHKHGLPPAGDAAPS